MLGGVARGEVGSLVIVRVTLLVEVERSRFEVATGAHTYHSPCHNESGETAQLALDSIILFVALSFAAKAGAPTVGEVLFLQRVGLCLL
jgi:hypothetical protein